MPESAVSEARLCHLACLGPVVLTDRDGGHPVLRTRKQLGLLLYLARRHGRPVGRDELIELLWSADQEKAARHSLSQSVSLINKSLGGEAIVTAGRERLAVAPDTVWLDVTAFERLAAEGRRDEAMALWRGPLFEGIWVQRAPHFERWVAEERDRLQRTFRRIAHGRLEELRSGGNHGAMRDAAERLLEVDGLDEKAMLVYLEALILLDDRSLALRRFGEFEKRLRAELNAEPGTALRSWARRHRKSDGPVAKAIPAMRVSEVMMLPTPQPLFGRTEEFAMLWDAWEQAKIGKGSFIIIEGEAGIGKTALATKLVNQAHVAGGSVCFVKCYRTEKSVPFAPVTALIRQLSRLPGFVGLDPVWIGELTRLVPELRDRYPNAPTPMAVDDAARHRLSDATVQAALAVADELPLMIVLDDLQDADEASLALFHYLSRQRHTATFILGLRRTGERPSDYESVFIETARASRLARTITLGGLGLADVEKLVTQVAASRGLDARADTVLRVATVCRGNPLHAIEAVVAADQSQKASSSATQGDEGRSFEDTARIRFGELPADARLLAGSLAVAGHPLNEFELAEVTALKPAELAMALKHLETTQFIARLGAKIGLAHERYVRAIESELVTSERVSIHQRLAHLLARAAANNPATRFEAACHFEAAGDSVNARNQAADAAKFASMVGAVRSEAEALELVARSSSSSLAEVGFPLGQCYLELNEFALLESLCNRLMQEPHSVTTECELDYLRIAAASESGSATMTELQHRLQDLLSRGVLFPHARNAQILLMRIADKTGDYELARRTARNLRRPRNQENVIDRYSLFAAGYVFIKYYYADRALPLLGKAMKEAQTHNDWATECLCRDGIGIALKHVGRFRESIMQFNTSIALSRKTMNLNSEASCLQNRAVSEMALGEWSQAMQTLADADSLPNASWGFRTYNKYNRAVCWLFMSDFSRALNEFREARDTATHHAMQYVAADATAGMAIAALRARNWDQFGTLSSDAMAIENPRQAPRAGWPVPVVAAWRRAVVDRDAEGALFDLALTARKAKKVDVSFWLSFELERIYLSEYLSGRRATLERQWLREQAARYEMRAINQLAS